MVKVNGAPVWVEPAPDLHRELCSLDNWLAAGPRGVQLTALPRTTLLYQVGLRAGDVLRSVNGRQLASTNDAIASYMAFARDGRSHIVIERGGAPLDLNVEMP
jgi:S1-C subfamily serine protease